MQPTYLPWLGYFDLIDQADKFVFLDNVQLEKSSWQLRNKIKTSQGELFLTVHRKKSKGQSIPSIADSQLNDEAGWKKKHLKTMAQSYSRAPFLKEIMSFFEPLIDNSTRFLAEFNMTIIKAIADKMGMKTEFLVSSKRFNKMDGKKDESLVKMCEDLNCVDYLSPQGSAVYIERNNPGGAFVTRVNLLYHHYEHPVYSQLHGNFLPFMGIVDLLFNCGFEKSLEVIRQGRKISIKFQDFRKPLIVQKQ